MAKAPKKTNGKRPGIGHNRGPRVTRARVGPLYRTYRFTDYDPVMAVLRTSVDDAKIKTSTIHKESGVSPSTIRSWFNGKTRKPQFATVVAVARSINATDRVTIGRVTDLIVKGK